MFKLRKSALIRAIQAACTKAGIDAETRHALQLALTGKASLTDMNVAELDDVLDAINAKTGYKAPQGRPAGVDTDAQLQKIEALLADMKLPWHYLSSSKRGPSMLKRLTGVDRLEWADDKGKRAIIAALVKRQEKEAHG